MKYLLITAFVAISVCGKSQSIVGTWQQIEVGSCLHGEFTETKTEKELLPSRGASGNTVAKLISFDEKGKGKEGVFSKHVKKGASMNDFKYTFDGRELLVLDKKSGIMTQRFIVDSLSESTLMVHNAMKDCEGRTFLRVK